MTTIIVIVSHKLAQLSCGLHDDSLVDLLFNAIWLNWCMTISAASREESEVGNDEVAGSGDIG